MQAKGGGGDFDFGLPQLAANWSRGAHQAKLEMVLIRDSSFLANGRRETPAAYRWTRCCPGIRRGLLTGSCAPEKPAAPASQAGERGTNDSGLAISINQYCLDWS